MAYRFEIIDEEYIEELKARSKKQAVLEELLKNERNFWTNLEEYESNLFDPTLSMFYAFWEI